MITAIICNTLLVVAALCFNVAAKASSDRPASAEPSPFNFDDDFNDFVEQQLKDWHVPGLSLAVIDNGQVFSKGYGYSNLPSAKATADTLWFTGSTTKAFTAAAVAGIVNDYISFPNMAWNTPVHTILPEEFVLSSEYSTLHTTLEDILSHRSGLPRHDLAYGWNNASAEDIVKTLRYLPMTAEPRTKWQYCNLMFAAAGRVVEKMTGKSLEQVLRDWFWGPLGMHSTMFSLQTAHDLPLSNKKSRLARGYWFVDKHRNCGGWQKRSLVDNQSDEDDCYYTPEPYMNITPIAGAGATISSVNDYAIWVRTLLDLAKLSKPDEPQYKFGYSMYRSVMRPRTLCPEEMSYGLPNGFIMPPNYSLGWMSRTIGPGYLITFHPGGLPGFGANVYLLPNEGFGFVSMGNTAQTSNIAGEFVFGEVLRRRFAEIDDSELAKFINAPAGFLGARWTDLTSLSPRLLNMSSSSDSNWQEEKKTAPAQLPRTIHKYAGIYRHPAYGDLNVTVLEKRNATLKQKHAADSEYQSPLTFSGEDDGVETLLVTPSKRMWDFKIILEPFSQEFFRTTLLQPHGPFTEDPIDFSDQEDCGKAKDITADRPLDCKRNVGWVPAAELFAAFGYEILGVADRLGIQMDREMINYDTEGELHYSGDWRTGMVWFQRISFG